MPAPGRCHSRRESTMFKPLMFALAGLGLTSLATASPLVEGQHYAALPQPVETRLHEGQIEVTEPFWYGSPHCYNRPVHVSTWYRTLPVHLGAVPPPGTRAS